MSKIKLMLIAGAFTAGLGACAQAMPISDLAAVDTGVKAEQAQWICNGYGWPNYYRPYAYYPRPWSYGGPRGWYGGPHWPSYRP